MIFTVTTPNNIKVLLSRVFRITGIVFEFVWGIFFILGGLVIWVFAIYAMWDNFKNGLNLGLFVVGIIGCTLFSAEIVGVGIIGMVDAIKRLKKRKNL